MFKAHFFTQTGYGQGKRELHDPPVLFHLACDPGERHNIAAQHADVIAAIQTEVHRHQEKLIPGKPQLD